MNTSPPGHPIGRSVPPFRSTIWTPSHPSLSISAVLHHVSLGLPLLLRPSGVHVRAIRGVPVLNNKGLLLKCARRHSYVAWSTNITITLKRVVGPTSCCFKLPEKFSKIGNEFYFFLVRWTSYVDWPVYMVILHRESTQEKVWILKIQCFSNHSTFSLSEPRYSDSISIFDAKQFLTFHKRFSAIFYE